MKTTLLALALLTGLLAIEPPAPSVEALQSEIAQLKADLKAAQITRNADMAACWTTDANAVNARFQAALAQKEAADLRNAPKAEALVWSGGPAEWTGKRVRRDYTGHMGDTAAMIVLGQDGYSLYDQRGCETPERPCRLEALVKSLDEAKARAKGW